MEQQQRFRVSSEPNNRCVLTVVNRSQFSTCYSVMRHVINEKLRVGEHILPSVLSGACNSVHYTDDENISVSCGLFKDGLSAAEAI
jgi:hypothetical protein